MTATDKTFNKLWEVVRQSSGTFTWPIGKASVERGFLINKEVYVENTATSTFVAKRLVCDHTGLRTVGGMLNVDIQNKKLRLSCAAARQKRA